MGQFLPDGLLNVLHETLGRHRAHVGSSTSDRNGVLGLFFFADNHQDRNSLEGRFTDPLSEGFVPVVYGSANFGIIQQIYNFFRIICVFFADRQHFDGFGMDPERQMAGGVLEEHGHETLQGAERGAVDHHRTLAGAVGIDILQLEALGEVVVHLDGAQLPAPADGVLHHEVQLRAVEGGFARLHDERQALLLRGLDDAGLGLLPVLVGTDVLGRVLGVAQGDLGGELVEVQGLEDVQDQVDDLLELFLDLVLAAEQVRVVLGESADAGQAVQLTGLLVAGMGWKESLPYLA